MIDDPLANGGASLDAEQPTAASLLRADIDELAEAYGSGAYAAEIAEARGDFDARRGRVFDDDELFTLHISMFLEHYCVERPLRETGRTPVLQRLVDGGDLDAETHARLLRLACSQRGVFEVRRQHDDAVSIRDLVRGGAFRLPDVVGLSVGEVFEGRLLPDVEGVRLGPVVLFHPREARAHIAALVAAASQADRDSLAIVDRLAEMRLRYGRFRNIAVHNIYA